MLAYIFENQNNDEINMKSMMMISWYWITLTFQINIILLNE
jgi:hypothetical protein